MKRREPLPLDLTPLLDVVFILLIFFIVTSVFKNNELALMLDLPSSHAKEVEIEEKQIGIELSVEKIAFNGKEINIKNLELELEDIDDKKKSIIFRVDKNVKYERLVKILDLLQKHNLNNLALVTQD